MPKNACTRTKCDSDGSSAINYRVLCMLISPTIGIFYCKDNKIIDFIQKLTSICDNMTHQNWPFTFYMISTKGIHDNRLIKFIFQLSIKALKFSDNNYSIVLPRGFGSHTFRGCFRSGYVGYDIGDLTRVSIQMHICCPMHCCSRPVRPVECLICWQGDICQLMYAVRRWSHSSEHCMGSQPDSRCHAESC